MARKASPKTLKRKADKLFSEFIRRKGYCEWCGKKDATLQCSHIFSRRFLVTRWEPINATALCNNCHRRWHEKPNEGREWIKKYLGNDVYEELELYAKTCVRKIDLEQQIELIKQYKHIEET